MFVAALLYCFAVSVAEKAAYMPVQEHYKAPAEQGSSLSKVPVKLLGCTQLPEYTVTGAKTLSQPGFKVTFMGLAVHAAAIERAFAQIFSSYKLSSHNFLSLFSGVDIIFPFHYFW